MLGKPQDKLTLHSRFRVKIGDDSRFECLVVLCVFQRTDDRLGSKPMPDPHDSGKRSLPSGVTAPVLLSALRRFASICLSELMIAPQKLASLSNRVPLVKLI